MGGDRTTKQVPEVQNHKRLTANAFAAKLLERLGVTNPVRRLPKNGLDRETNLLLVWYVLFTTDTVCLAHTRTCGSPVELPSCVEKHMDCMVRLAPVLVSLSSLRTSFLVTPSVVKICQI